MTPSDPQQRIMDIIAERQAIVRTHNRPVPDSDNWEVWAYDIDNVLLHITTVSPTGRTWRRPGFNVIPIEESEVSPGRVSW